MVTQKILDEGMQGMGESRTELLAWLNDLLLLGYTKIEQCGSGAAHCQIIDSIYRDVPLSKVKFNARHEYEYIQNFKVLQSAFDKHRIDNAIPVERLSKCKMQDNLEFLQWLKKYWDQFYPGGNYDAISRRKGEGSNNSSAAPRKPISTSSPNIKKASSVRSINERPTAVKTSSSKLGSATMPGRSNPNISSNNALVEELKQKNVELTVSVDQIEKEREFYFEKLRSIEDHIQGVLEGGRFGTVESTLKTIQQIMYQTADGFEIPADDPVSPMDEEITY